MPASMSDCTYNGVSNKVEVQNAITVCTGGDTTDPGSPSTEVPSTTAPIPATTASNTNCVASEISDMVDLYTAVGSSDECADDSSVSSTSIVITTFCGSACASKLEELATSLPNCYYGYQSENLKADLLKQLDGCTGDDTSYAINVVLSPEEATEEPSTTSPPASTTSPPASTTAPPATDTNSTSEPTPAPTQGDLGTYC